MIHYDRVLTVFIHFLCDRSVRYRDGRGGVDTGGVHEKNTKSNPGSGFIVSFLVGRLRRRQKRTIRMLHNMPTHACPPTDAESFDRSRVIVYHPFFHRLEEGDEAVKKVTIHTHNEFTFLFFTDGVNRC